jgi:DNA-binding transcriptional MerR regulator
MKKRIKEYSVGELAGLSGVTVRTLHHYDAVGLLRPAHVALNGYRTYGHAELLRLQEILFYRAFGLSLAEIDAVLRCDASTVSRLRTHRARLAAQVEEVTSLLKTLDLTIETLTKESDMPDTDLYKPFDAATQTAYEVWMIDTYGPDMAAKIAQSKEAIDAMPKGMVGAMEELSMHEAKLVDAYQAGASAGDGSLIAILDAHRALMGRLWGENCAPEAYAGLSDMYLAHPDFVARYERLAPRFSQWLPSVMKAYAADISV